MSLKKNDIEVDCKHCKFSSSNDAGDFEVTVPIRDLESGISGQASLVCKVSSNSHYLKLGRWTDEFDQAIQASENIQQRLYDALDYVAEKKVCGNQGICPSDVMEFVKKYGDS